MSGYPYRRTWRESDWWFCVKACGITLVAVVLLIVVSVVAIQHFMDKPPSEQRVNAACVENGGAAHVNSDGDQGVTFVTCRDGQVRKVDWHP